MGPGAALGLTPEVEPVGVESWPPFWVLGEGPPMGADWDGL